MHDFFDEHQRCLVGSAAQPPAPAQCCCPQNGLSCFQHVAGVTRLPSLQHLRLELQALRENEVQQLAHWLPRLDSLELVLTPEDHLACVCSLSLLGLLPADELRLNIDLPRKFSMWLQDISLPSVGA